MSACITVAGLSAVGSSNVFAQSACDFGKCYQYAKSQDLVGLRNELGRCDASSMGDYRFPLYSGLLFYQQGGLAAGDFERETAVRIMKVGGKDSADSEHWLDKARAYGLQAANAQRDADCRIACAPYCSTGSSSTAHMPDKRIDVN